MDVFEAKIRELEAAKSDLTRRLRESADDLVTAARKQHEAEEALFALTEAVRDRITEAVDADAVNRDAANEILEALDLQPLDRRWRAVITTSYVVAFDAEDAEVALRYLTPPELDAPDGTREWECEQREVVEFRTVEV
jgi:hypothetical protein